MQSRAQLDDDDDDDDHENGVHFRTSQAAQPSLIPTELVPFLSTADLLEVQLYDTGLRYRYLSFRLSH